MVFYSGDGAHGDFRDDSARDDNAHDHVCNEARDNACDNYCDSDDDNAHEHRDDAWVMQKAAVRVWLRDWRMKQVLYKPTVRLLWIFFS